MAADDYVHRHKPDVVPIVGVSRTGIAQAEDEKHGMPALLAVAVAFALALGAFALFAFFALDAFLAFEAFLACASLSPGWAMPMRRR